MRILASLYQDRRPTSASVGIIAQMGLHFLFPP
jgi:hypothetical protein